MAGDQAQGHRRLGRRRHLWRESWRDPRCVPLKIGAAPEGDMNEAMEWGIELDVIARKFSQRTGFAVKRCNMVLQHPEHDWMLANIDRYVRDNDEPAWGVLEVKNVGEYRAEDWADGAVPDYYNIQVQHYMEVLGADYAWLCPLIGGRKLQPVKVMRSDSMIRSLVKIERDFWHLVETRTPPIDDSPTPAKSSKLSTPIQPPVSSDEGLYLHLRLRREGQRRRTGGARTGERDQVTHGGCGGAMVPGSETSHHMERLDRPRP